MSPKTIAASNVPSRMSEIRDQSFRSFARMPQFARIWEYAGAKTMKSLSHRFTRMHTDKFKQIEWEGQQRRRTEVRNDDEYGLQIVCPFAFFRAVQCLPWLRPPQFCGMISRLRFDGHQRRINFYDLRLFVRIRG
jgi:hypothetical protein